MGQSDANENGGEGPVIDPKLQKALQPDGKARPEVPVEAFLADCINGLAEADRIVTLPRFARSRRLAAALLAGAVADRRVLMTGPEIALGPVARHRTVLALPSPSNTESAGVDIRPFSELMRHPERHLRHSPPDLVVVDSGHYLDHPEAGPAMELLLGALHPETALILILCGAAAPDPLADWLTARRGRPCIAVAAPVDPARRVGAFMGAGGDLVPLTDRKRLSNRTRKLRADRPADGLKDPSSVRRLTDILRDAEMAPALLVVPSGAAADRAVSACPKTGESRGVILTHSAVVAILDRHPELKESRLLLSAISRRAAGIHSGHRLGWRELVDQLLALGALDWVFGTPSALAGLETAVAAVVTVTTASEQTEGPPEPMDPWEADRIIRLAGRGPSEQAGCVVVPHVDGADPVWVKDHLLKTGVSPSGAFDCTVPTVLYLHALPGDPLERLRSGYTAARKPAFGSFCLREMDAECADLLPEARCSGHLISVARLRDIHLRTRMAVDRVGMKLAHASGKARSWLRARKAATEAMISLLPCEACPHTEMCHGRGSRRFRNLMQAVETAPDAMDSRNPAWLERAFAHRTAALTEAGLISEGTLTPSGRLALRSGIKRPQALVEAIGDWVLPLNRGPESVALCGAFLDEDVGMGEPVIGESMDAYRRRLSPDFERMAPAVDAARRTALRYGLLPAAPDPDRAAVILSAAEGTAIETLAGWAQLPAGEVERLAHGAERLHGLLVADADLKTGGDG
jgi:hypothetical protein